LIVFYNGFVNDRRTKPPQPTKTSTLFFIIDGEPISIELNKCDLDGLDSKGVRQVFTKIPKYSPGSL